MVRNILLTLVVVLVTGGLTWFLNNDLRTNRGSFFILEQGQSVPDFAFETIEGQSHHYYDFTDQTVLIHFWASWCPPCVVEFPDLLNFARENPDVITLAISTDISMTAMERFLTRHAPDIPENVLIIHDEDKSITEGKFSVFALPETYITADNAILKDHIVGPKENWAAFSP